MFLATIFLNILYALNYCDNRNISKIELNISITSVSNITGSCSWNADLCCFRRESDCQHICMALLQNTSSDKAGCINVLLLI